MKVTIAFYFATLLLVQANNCDLTHHHSAKPSALLIKTCCDLRTFPVTSGVYKMSTGTFSTSDVYCDMSTSDGGWIVIQRNRKNSRLSFNKNWKEYEDGFGDLNGDFWAGLKLIRALTESGQWEMRVDYQKEADKSWTYLQHDQFSIEGPSKGYQLHVSGYNGPVTSDPFTKDSNIVNGMKFSTYDNGPAKSCAVTWKGGWWYNGCYRININRQPPIFEHPQIALFTEMKIRPKGCIAQ